MKKIQLDYEESNDKWYLMIDGDLTGKFYTLESALSQLIFRDIGLNIKR